MNNQIVPLSFDPHTNPNFSSQELWIYSDQLSSINGRRKDWMKRWKWEGKFQGMTPPIQRFFYVISLTSHA